MGKKLGEYQVRHGLNRKGDKNSLTKEVKIVEDFANYKFSKPPLEAKFIPGNFGIELNAEQLKAIEWYVANPPKYLKWFIPFYRKYISKAIFLLILSCIIMAIVHAVSSVDLFDTIKYVFFVAGGLGLWALEAHLFKVFYTKRYAKKIGLTLKEWDWVTIGQRWDI